jgi:hypothetical protein
MEVATRRVYFAGGTTNPDEAWMKQIARNLTDSFDGFLLGKRYILMDRDAKFCEAFRSILKPADVNHMERFMRSLKEECLNRLIFFGDVSLRKAVGQFVEHYHQERNHQGLGNRLIEPGVGVGRVAGEVACRERLGGLLQYYYRDAA